MTKRGPGGLWVVLGGLLLTTSACAGRYGTATFDETAAANNIATVEVTNNYGLPVKVYMIGSSINRSLGTVHPGMTSRFTIPPWMIGNGSLELFASAGDGRPPMRTGPLLIAAGRVVDFQVSRFQALSFARMEP